jgi:hypothetical protein
MAARNVAEFPPGDMAAERAWGAWRVVAIAGRISLEDARKHGVDHILLRNRRQEVAEG